MLRGFQRTKGVGYGNCLLPNGRKPLPCPVLWCLNTLTRWGRVTHICVGNSTIIGSDNGLSPGRAPSHYLNQCWNIVNRTLGNKLQWNLNAIETFSFKEMHLKLSSAKWRPFCIGLSVLRQMLGTEWAHNATVTNQPAAVRCPDVGKCCRCRRIGAASGHWWMEFLASDRHRKMSGRQSYGNRTMS